MERDMRCDLLEVVEATDNGIRASQGRKLPGGLHYNRQRKLDLTERQQQDLVEYLKSL